jgi:chemotaxis protein CheX
MEKQYIIDAIQSATLEVFTTMLASDPAVGEAYAEHKASGVADGVVALIGLTGQWIGTGMVTCSAGLAAHLSASLLMTETPADNQAITEEVLDAMAEITNMVIGNVKNLLEANVGELTLSIPTVVYGRNLTTRSVNDGEWVVVPFICGDERMEVKVCLVAATSHSQGRASCSASLHA